MRELSKKESAIFLIGGALMVAGVALNFFGFSLTAPWIFTVGALSFSSMQIRQTYDGHNFAIKRLRKIMTIADVLFVISSVLLIENNYNFLLPLFGKYGLDGIIAYNQYIAHNNWVVILLIAAVIELYTTHRISSELAKDAKKM